MASSIENHSNDKEERNFPPAFLDLADSTSRGAGPEMASHMVHQKRLEHERLREIHRKQFEEQMRMLEQQHLKEEIDLLGVPVDLHQIAVSAPTTPPRVMSTVHGDQSGKEQLFDTQASQFSSQQGNYTQNGAQYPMSVASQTVDKRKSVTYGPGLENNDRNGVLHNNQGYAGAKSMPTSRRGSPGSRDGDDILVQSLHGLSINDNSAANNKPMLRQTKTTGRFGDMGDYQGGYNAGLMLDDELDQDINHAIKFLPSNSDDAVRNDPYPKLSASSAALDLAPLSQTPPRPNFMNRVLDASQKSSEWPPFSGPARPESVGRISRPFQTVGHGLTPVDIGVGKLTSSASTPLVQSHSPIVSRHSSPRGFVGDNVLSSLNSRSVPPTPLNAAPHSSGGQGSMGSKSSTPAVPNGQEQLNLGQYSGLGTPNEMSNSPMQRLGSQYDNSNGYGLSHGMDNQYDMDPHYGMNGGMDNRFQSGYGQNYDAPHRGTGGGYHNQGGQGGRYGLGGGRGVIDHNSRINGLHAKHKRPDIDREYNRFAGNRLEDLIGEIPSMCKDQHGCRFLQKKLEEGLQDHRDIIFRETFNHFADLMTDPFGNYLCQKLLEYSTDDQRNLICESVAGDLVTISLNMHGTRAVQKMIDFLSTQRQADPRYNDQIIAIIRALSLHVVTLIKDLNGNHVIQKCLNRLVPEDNQFIYNAVAAHCVEVATHRHGCCVLQRCIDHASETQRIQLVTEITYNALTLVQDPYGNYVVQYILDLNDNRFSDAVIRQFFGNVCALSVQKFSSNVIEKCIRVAEHTTRKLLIEELLNRTRLEKLLRDSFGNYCVQTALDYAEPNQRMLLVEGIRPILPLIRNTPYGKRIQSKLQREQMEINNNVGHYTNNYHQNPHAALVNMAMNNSLSAQGNVRIQHASPLVSDYSRSPALYGLSPTLLPTQQGSPLVSHSQSSGMYNSPSQDNYGSQTSPLGQQGSGSYQGLGGYGNGLQGVFGGNTVNLGASIDPYQQRGNFQY